MPGAGRHVHPKFETPKAPVRRASQRSLSKITQGACDPDGSPVAIIPDRFWVFWVAVVTLPSLIFGLWCAFFLTEDFAEFLDLGSAGALVASIFIGGGTTLAAFIITMIATLRARTTRITRIALWILVASSLACWLYVWISFSAIHQVPPHIPLKM